MELKTKTWLLVGLALVGGGGVGVLTARRHDAAFERDARRQLEQQSETLRSIETQVSASRQAAALADPPLVERTPAGSASVGAPSVEQIRAEVATAVKQALDDHYAATEGEPRPKKQSAAPTEANWVAYRHTEAMLERAIAAKTWTESDVEAFREDMRQVTWDQRRALMERLMTAVNTDQVQVVGKHIM